jgi:aspartate/methionine/tyrosine aminotransferase
MYGDPVTEMEPRAATPVALSPVFDGFLRSGIREMMDLASTLDGVIHLEIGEPDFPTPPHVVEAVQRALDSGAVKYTLSRGEPRLRELLAEKLKRVNGLDVGAADVVVTTGGTGAVSAAMTALVGAGDVVLLPEIGWPTYEMVARLVGARVRYYRLLPESGFEPDIDHLETLARDARLLVVNSPSNPTGGVVSPGAAEAMMELAQRHNLAVLSDEVYEQMVFDGEHVSFGTLDEDGRVVTVHSFSKTFSMTGWRIGYLAAAPHVVEAIVKVQEAVVACPSWVGQRAAEAALTGPQTVVEEMNDAYRQRRDLAHELLEGHGLATARPRGTFYALARFGSAGADTYAFARRLLEEERVAVAPGETFGPAGGGLVRLSLASSPALISEGIARLATAAKRSADLDRAPSSSGAE